MKAEHLIIMCKPSGGWTAHILGRPEDPKQSTNGNALRTIRVPNQPHRGFKSKNDAKAAAKKFLPNWKAVEKYAKQFGGTYLSAENKIEIIMSKPETGEGN